MNVLGLGAHPDDIELMAGGTIAKWKSEGHNVHVLRFTDGVWTAPGGELMREKAAALAEERAAAKVLGYSVENLEYQALALEFKDQMVVDTLKRIQELKIDTIICPWERDSNHDHEIVARIAFAASRKVSRVLMGQINYYLREVFAPNIFVDISNTFDQKIQSLECYESQWSRQGTDWHEFLDVTSRYYGKMIGVKRAEGFVTSKFLL
jgi:LmbE family N-acetylglucosaminyl deacetylase